MPIETEKKYRLTAEQRASVIEELRSINAEYCGEDFEENLIFGGVYLDETAAVLRIRRTENRNTLTYKKRIFDGAPVKRQIEYEAVFAADGQLTEIVENLGLECRLIYEKRRKTWRIDNVEIVLDELPFGSFMEIEGSLTEIRRIEMMIGAEDYEVEHGTYPSLTGMYGVVKDGITEARFNKG